MTATILSILAIVGGLITAFFAGHSKGKSKAEVVAAEQRTKDNDALAAKSVERNQAAVKEQVKSIQESNDEDEAVRRLSDADLFNELRNGAGTAENDRSGKK